MTTEEAVKMLERIQDPEPYEPQITKSAYEALQMGIDALKKEIPTKRKTKRGIRRFVTNWLDGEQNKPRKQTSKIDMIDQWATNMERNNNEESGIF